MSVRRAGNLLSRVLLAATETISKRLSTPLVSHTRSAASYHRYASLWHRALGPWNESRSAAAQQLRAYATTPATAQDDEQASMAQAEQNIGAALVKLEAEAMELAAEGEPERCVPLPVQHTCSAVHRIFYLLLRHVIQLQQR
jgi:hypothetical protein